MLRQGDGDDSLFRIDLAVSRCRAVPAELAKRRGKRKVAEVGRHLDAKSKAFLASGSLIVGEHDHMIGGHQFDGLAAKNTVAFERPAVAKHLREPRKITCGREDPGAAGFNSAPRLRPGLNK